MDFLVEKLFPHVKNHFCRKKNFAILKRKFEDLKGLKEEKESLKSIELRPRKKLKTSVEIWFQNVEKIEEILNGTFETEVAESSVFSCTGEKVLEMISEIDQLLQDGTKFDDNDLVMEDPQWIGQVLSTTPLYGDVPKKLMKEIWEYLKYSEVSKIGVCGMGGVGKTTIMKLINNQLLKETDMFDKVIWVTVSSNFDIAKLQNDIVHGLKVPDLFENDDDQTRRAGMLSMYLTHLAVKSKYVLILDDLWENLSLEEVGIPEPSNGSKLVVTTRLSHVCSHLNCEEVKIPCLERADARSLFLEKVGKNILNYPDLLPIVESVCDECDGLPLAIVTIAASMRGEHDVYTWRNALNQLKKHVRSVDGMEEKIFQRLQFSYERLGDEKLKLCFLYAALYPEDNQIPKDKLIGFWIDEGYIGDMNSMQAEIDRGHAILNKLKNSSLIEEGYNSSMVKLHDLLRDMALRMRPQFFVRAGMQLKKIPDVKEWEAASEKVSLIWNRPLQIPSQISPPKCPMLTTLLLSNCDIESIPTCFFEQMPELKILDLSWNFFKSLPNSISNLERLTVLLLEGCGFLKKIPSLSKLRALKKLDCLHSDVDEFPSGMDELINLRYLRFMAGKSTDVGILRKLTSLQHFEIFTYRYEGWELASGGRIGNELVVKLECLRIWFDGLEVFNSYTQSLEDEREGKGPPRYSITIGEKIFMEKECELCYEESFGEEEHLDNFEKVIQFMGTVITENMKLPSNVEVLYFEDIINRYEAEVFLPDLITPCGPNTNFSNLKIIFVGFLKKNSRMNTKKLFSLDWAMHNLQNLEELCIKNWFDREIFGEESDSKEIKSESELDLEEIIGLESETDLKLSEEPIQYCKLPRLRVLVLENLRELKSICSPKVALACDSITQIVIKNCPKLEKRMPLIFPLGVDGLPSPPTSLKSIYVSRDWWESAEWDQPQAKDTVNEFVNFDDWGWWYRR